MARRTRGDGTVFYDNTNQRWTGRVTIDGKRRTVVAKTKTEAARRLREIRSLDAPANLIETLHQHHIEQDTERAIAGADWSNPDNLVWTNSVGSPTDPSRIRHAFTRTVTDAGIGTGWSPNSLRHTTASLLSDAGIPLEDIAAQLGHKDTRMASLHYRHRVKPTISTGLHMNNIIDAT